MTPQLYLLGIEVQHTDFKNALLDLCSLVPTFDIAFCRHFKLPLTVTCFSFLASFLGTSSACQHIRVLEHGMRLWDGEIDILGIGARFSFFAE
jgi:hypothetical protein